MNKSTDAVTKPERVGVDERIVARITEVLRTPEGTNQRSVPLAPATKPSVPMPADRARVW